MSHVGPWKAAIDCLKWPKGVNFETHRVIAGQVKEDAIHDLIILKTLIEARDEKNQTDWEAYVEKHYRLGQSDDAD